jgi:hypothetical protein
MNVKYSEMLERHLLFAALLLKTIKCLKDINETSNLRINLILRRVDITIFAVEEQ